MAINIKRRVPGRSVALATIAFFLGSASVVTGGPAVSGFVGLIDGNNTAAINVSRELSVVDAGANGSLAAIRAATDKLGFDSNGLKVSAQGTQQVTGLVSVSNFPATQTVGGTVSVGNTPAVGDARVTTVLDAQDVTLAATFFNSALFPTTAYSQVRVNVISFESCATPLQLLVFAVSRGPTNGFLAQMDEAQVCFGRSYSKSFDVPGEAVMFSLLGNVGQSARASVVAR